MRIFRAQDNSDQGSVLIVAVMVMGVAIGLSLLVLKVAITSGSTSGFDRQRATAVSAAEAGVDASYASIQSSGAALPCGWPTTGTQQVGSFPDPATVKSTITYYNTGGVLACPVGGSLAAGQDPVRAMISSVATTGSASSSTRSTRRMEALVNLSSVGGNILDKPFLGDAGVSINQAGTIRGNAGNDADVYSNGNFTCGSSPVIEGSVFVPFGSALLDNSCRTLADTWARDSVTLSGQKTIGGRVLSSQSTVTATGNTGINGTVLAAGAISWPNCGPGQCLSNQSNVPPPPAQRFPVLNDDATALSKWTEQGYTIIGQPAGVACGQATGNWIRLNAPSLASKTLLKTTCDVAFSNFGGGSSNVVNFGVDFALFARGGITTSQTVNFTSTGTATTPKAVHMVVPYNAATSVPCTSPSISVGNSFSSDEKVSLLWYSPCNVVYGNGGASYGGVYSGSVLSSGNAFTLTYRPITVFGITPGSANPTAHKVDIVYKREDRL